jgi:hypothetical protein
LGFIIFFSFTNLFIKKIQDSILFLGEVNHYEFHLFNLKLLTKLCFFQLKMKGGGIFGGSPARRPNAYCNSLFDNLFFFVRLAADRLANTG